MKKAWITMMVFLTCHQFTLAQDSIAYVIGFPNAKHHEAEITIKLRELKDKTIKLNMSKSSPGRYAEHQFSKNVYNLHLTEDGNARIKKKAPDAWEITDIDKSIDIKYTLYANHANGTYSGIDRDFAVINMPAALIWIDGMEQTPVKVLFDLPDTSTWKIATQLHLLDSTKNMYSAPDLQYLMDSPCMLGKLKFSEFYTDDDSVQRIRLAINTDAGTTEINKLSNMTKQVLAEQKEIFGEYPNFKDSTYTFLCSYGQGNFGDGMEHRNSTMITSEIPLAGNQDWLIGSLSHEFFHAWNMERIRPASLEPFDFTRANMSGELWFGEGFTNYYGDLTLCRSGLTSQDKYLYTIGSTINYLANTPGWKYGSPVHMSEMAPFVDQASFVDETNFANTFVSYYTYGEMIALALDLSLRTNFKNATLDDYMRSVWTKYGKKEIAYTNDDLLQTLGEVCGDKQFANDFFNKYIFGNTLPDYTGLFDKIGYLLIKKNPNKPSIGFARFSFKGDTATMISDPLIGTALYEAGVNKDDLILSIDDQAVTSYPELNFIIGTRKIGDEIEVVYSHHGKKMRGTFKLKEDEQLVLIPKEKFSLKISEEETELREKWLGAKQ